MLKSVFISLSLPLRRLLNDNFYISLARLRSVFTLFRAGPQSLGRWWCKMIINVGNKFNLILVVCAASYAFAPFISSFSEFKSFLRLTPLQHSQVENSIWLGVNGFLLSDGSNLVFYLVAGQFRGEWKQERRLLVHSGNRLMNLKSWKKI